MTMGDVKMSMYVKQPKKLLILNILDILHKYSDADHKLSLTQIAEILKSPEYDMEADRKAVNDAVFEAITEILTNKFMR